MAHRFCYKQTIMPHLQSFKTITQNTKEKTARRSVSTMGYLFTSPGEGKSQKTGHVRTYGLYLLCSYCIRFLPFINFINFQMKKKTMWGNGLRNFKSINSNPIALRIAFFWFTSLSESYFSPFAKKNTKIKIYFMLDKDNASLHFTLLMPLTIFYLIFIDFQ